MKALLKATLRGLSFLVVSPLVLLFTVQAWVVGRNAAFPGWSQLVSMIPGKLGVYLRHAFYRCTLRSCQPDACISFGTIFSHPNASVGQTAYIGNYCSIGDVQIGDDVLIASHVSIMNGCNQHGTNRLDMPIREQAGTYEPVSIGQDTWIGERATVAANVGKHCVIGAGSLVLHPIPDYAIAVGVPARVIRDRRELASNRNPKVQHPELPVSQCNADLQSLVR